jgi:hypothetical protein
MTLSAGIVALLLEAVAIAALAAHPAGARAGVVLAVAMLPFPAFVDADPLPVALLATGAFWMLVRGLDFALEAPHRAFPARFVHLFALIDTRLVARGERRLDFRWVSVAALAFALLVAALLAIVAAEEREGAARLAQRWLGGVVLMFATFELLTALIRIVTGLLALSAPALSDTPHLSRSVAEFWSERWNLVVGRVLRERVFRPLVHRGAALAVFATFAISAAFHAYIVGVAIGYAPALVMATFFLVQPLVLAVERRLRPRRWPVAARHAWTLGVLAALSPLFVEPILRVVDPTLRRLFA